MNHLDLKITVLDSRGKNFFPSFCQVVRLDRNGQGNAIMTSQGPLCAAETANLHSNHPIGFLQSQQVSEARNRANPGSHPSWSTWQTITAEGQELEWLHVSSYLTLPPKEHFLTASTPYEFSHLKIALTTRPNKQKKQFSKKSDRPGTSRQVANTQERGSTGYIGQFKVMHSNSLCTIPLFMHTLRKVIA